MPVNCSDICNETTVQSLVLFVCSINLYYKSTLIKIHMKNDSYQSIYSIYFCILKVWSLSLRSMCTVVWLCSFMNASWMAGAVVIHEYWVVLLGHTFGRSNITLLYFCCNQSIPIPEFGDHWCSIIRSRVPILKRVGGEDLP